MTIPNNTTDYTNLVSLGIPSDLIDQANIPEEFYKRLFNQLKPLMRMASPRLIIDAPWQLQVLTGKMNSINLSSTQQDNWGSTFSHYAALSGNPEALQWVADNRPGLLTKKDNYGLTIAHYAAWSGSHKALQWVADNRPGLLTEKDNYGRTIAHYAALSGNIKALQWVADNRPELLTRIDKDGLTIAHYAALSGNIKALQWVADNRPELLTRIDNYGLTIAHYAALSGNPCILNKALYLSGTPELFDVPNNLSNKNVVVKTLLSALDDNFTLVEVLLPIHVNPDQRAAIAEKILRNRAIKEATTNFSVFAQGFHQTESTVSSLIAIEILLETFKKMLPTGLPEEKIRNAFKKVMFHYSPEGRLDLILGEIKTAVLGIINKFHQDNVASRENLFHKIGLIETNKAKKDTISSLEDIIKKEKSSLDDLRTQVKNYYQENEAVIKHQRNKIHAFFSPNHKTTTDKMFDQIFKTLGSVNEISSPSISAPGKSE